MPRGDKSSYTDRQKRQAEHIEKALGSRSAADGGAGRQAWASVSKESGGRRKARAPRSKHSSAS